MSAVVTADVVALVGNPRPGSRTRWVAERVADRVAAHLPGPSEPQTVDLADLAPLIFLPGDVATGRARLTVANARVAVVATPVYKASYTGLLKAFLDGYGPDGLADIVVVPVVVTGSERHALAGEVHLKPVLAELGAVTPTPVLTVAEAQLAQLDEVLDVWFGRWQAALNAALGTTAGARTIDEGVRP